MVHAFSFTDEESHYFLWDTESGSLHEVDYATFLYAKKRYKLSLSEQEIKHSLTIKDTREIEAELQEAEVEGILASQEIVHNFVREFRYIKALCLHICHDCNMTCEYCFASGGSYNCSNDYMSIATGRAAVDFLIDHSGNRRNLEIDFFGGEPLLNMDTVKAVVDYAQERAKQCGKSFYFTLTTNCILLNKKNAEYINSVMDNVVLSIDGRPSVHNNIRHLLSGRDSYDRVVDNALFFRNLRKEGTYYARGTFTRANLDFANDIKHLIDLGFTSVSVEPVVLPSSHTLAIREEDLPIIYKEYDKLAHYLLQKAKDGEDIKFFHFMIDLEKGPCLNKRLTGCGAGCEYLAISPSGDIYPCHQFVGTKYKMGNVFDNTVDADIASHFAHNTLVNQPDCRDCFAKYYCGGGCAANAYNFTGSIDGNYQIGCEMLRKRLELALALYALTGKIKDKETSAANI